MELLQHEHALRGLAEELKCPLCIDILKPPCARPACCHYLCSTCLTELLKNRQECPICNGPLRRRDIRGDDRIDRIATLVSQLQSLSGRDRNDVADVQPLQPVQNLPLRHGKSKQKLGELRGSTSRQEDVRKAEPAGAAQGHVAQQPLQTALAGTPATSDGSQHSPVAASAATDTRAFDTLGGSSGDHLQQRRVFRRQKRKPADDDPDPRLQQEQQQPAHQDEQAVKQQPSSRQKRGADQQLQGAERAGHAPERKADPYDFHSSGSQPSGPQATLVAPPTASAARPGAAAAGGPPASASAAGAAPSEDGNAQPGQRKTAKRPRGTAAAAASSAVVPAASSGASQMSEHTGRRIPGRLVPWSCSACTFENPASAQQCGVCTTARPKQQAQTHAGVPPTQRQHISRVPTASKRQPAAEHSSKREVSAEQSSRGHGTSPADSVGMPGMSVNPAASEGAAKRPGAGMLLVPSGMDSDAKAALAAYARAIGARYSKKWHDGATHVVCGATSPAAVPKRTLTFMLGVLAGRWVVSLSWLPPPGNASINSEEQHEVKGGPPLARLSHAANAAPLLDGYEIHLAGKFGRRDEFARLVRAAGARLLSRAPAQDGSTTSKKATAAPICLYDEETCSWGNGRRPKHVWHVSSKWLSDTASAYVVAPLEEYIVDHH